MKHSHVTSDSSQRFFPGKGVRTEKKKWGEEHWIVNKEYCGKKLLLQKDRRCSLHKHKQKDEVFYLQSGKVLLELDGTSYTLEKGDFIHIPAGSLHRFTGLQDSEMIEFSTHHVEEDSYREEFSGHAEPKRYERQFGVLKQFSKQSVLVVGDVMLDCYTAGSVDRISPEAPIPILQVSEQRNVLGGAGNAAANIRALGSKVKLLSVCGQDSSAQEVKNLLKAHGIQATILTDAKRPTTRKERLLGHNSQQIVRIDTEDTEPLSSALEKRLIQKARSLSASSSAILISDYAKGVLSPKFYKALYALGRTHGIPVVVDPKPRDVFSLKELKGATAVTPNVHEARTLLHNHRLSEENLGRELSKTFNGMVYLTRGSQGMDICTKGKRLAHFDSLSPEVVDVSGAGDTVSVVIALCLAIGATAEDTADISNRAASAVVQKHGTATLDIDELESVL